MVKNRELTIKNVINCVDYKADALSETTPFVVSILVLDFLYSNPKRVVKIQTVEKKLRQLLPIPNSLFPKQIKHL